MPVLSIVIPTRDRAKYAVDAVRSSLSRLTNIEVIVCDSSRIDEVSDGCKDLLLSKKLKIVRTDPGFSVVDNFNEALLHVSGRYVVFIGDDDFVTLDIVKVAEWADENNIDSVRFSFPVLYFWDDFGESLAWGASGGTLQLGSFSGKAFAEDPTVSLDRAIKNLGGGVFNMPRAYAGMISRDLISRICNKHGRLFGGVSPDIYSAALISLESKRSYFLDYPIVIPGASGASTSGQSAKGAHLGSLRDNDHIRPFKNLIWDERIPEFYSVPTVWSYSLVKAAEHAGLVIPMAAFSKLYVKCLMQHRSYHAEIKKSISAHVKSRKYLTVYSSLITAFSAEFVRLAKRFCEKKINRFSLKKNIVVDGIPTGSSAANYLDEYLPNSSKLILEKRLQ